MDIVRCVTPPQEKKDRTTSYQDSESYSYGPCLLATVSQEEVKCWLARFLPGLQEEEGMHYTAQLIANGFDCCCRMVHLREEDLHFMSIVHRRALVGKLNSIPVKGLDISNK